MDMNYGNFLLFLIVHSPSRRVFYGEHRTDTNGGTCTVAWGSTKESRTYS